MSIDPNQPHYYKRRQSIIRSFNLDAPKPCLYCGREPSASIHYPPSVQLYLARQERAGGAR